jgi:hypothetical protein
MQEMSLTAGTIEILRGFCGRYSVPDANFRRIKGVLQIGWISHPLGGINVAGVWPAELRLKLHFTGDKLPQRVKQSTPKW